MIFPFSCEGEKWAGVWNPEVGVGVRQGDKLCSLAAERLNVTSFPNQQFPRGIMVSSQEFKNLNLEKWKYAYC